MDKNILLAIVLIVGLGVGAVVGYYAAPPKIVTQTQTVTVEKLPLTGKTIKIGNIASSADSLQTEQPLQQYLTGPDLNAFATLLGYNTKYEFLLDNANEQPAVHLEKVQSFKSMGVNLIIGGRWSAQAQGSLPYVNQNKMLLFSSSSTSPLLAIKDDNLYRMCPDDTVQAPAIAAMLRAWGIKAVIVIQRGDSWADGIYNIFATEFPKRGGVIIDRVRYAPESKEFSSYLQIAEGKIGAAIQQYGATHVAIEIISFEESAVMLQQAEGFKSIYGLIWFGSDGSALSQPPVDSAPVQASHLKVLSTMAAPAASEKYITLAGRFEPKAGRPFGYYSACVYDIATTMMQATLEAQDDTTKDATKIIPLIQSITYNQWGASGWTKLNEAGDRAKSNYDIWGYVIKAGKGDHAKFGFYDGAADTVLWDVKALAAEGLTIPGGG